MLVVRHEVLRRGTGRWVLLLGGLVACAEPLPSRTAGSPPALPTTASRTQAEPAPARTPTPSSESRRPRGEGLHDPLRATAPAGGAGTKLIAPAAAEAPLAALGPTPTAAVLTDVDGGAGDAGHLAAAEESLGPPEQQRPSAPAPSADEVLRSAWPKRALAFHRVTFLYAAPRPGAPVVGYLRRGAELAARPLGRGWVELPGGIGRLGEGLALRPARLLGFVPPPPETEAPLPYRYHRVRAPFALRLAEPVEAPEQLEALRQAVAERLAEREAARGGDAGTDHDGMPDGGGPSWPEPVVEVLLRGFVIAEGAREQAGETGWVRDLRGRWVAAERLAPVEAPAARGVTLSARRTLPLAFVTRRARLWRWDAERGRLTAPRWLERGAVVPLLDGVVERIDGRRGCWSRSGALLELTAGVRIARAVARPPAVPAEARWVHVDLAAQTLVAYEGDRPRFSTVVSTGRKGFETPTGLYRIGSKHVSTTMDDLQGAEPFLLEEVPWTQFFHEGLALHAAYWHDRFGRRRSHGCVNLAPADARWLFRFTEPVVPPGWHGRRALPSEPSSFVWLTDGLAERPQGT